MVASEARPIATTGGLAEVLGGLPRALARLGHRVTVILPNYGKGPALEGEPEGAILDFGQHQQPVGFFETTLGDGINGVLVDAPELFRRPGLYGDARGDYPDNAYRFAVLSLAALEYVRRRGERPSVIHAHDWQAGLVPAYQKMLFSNDPTVGGVPAVFTIHNMAFQGLFPASTLPAIGLPWDVLHVQAMEFWGQISFLKAGINFSERLTTVSPTYAREVLTPERGCGFDGVLARRRESLVGILNGIDTDRWNPATDTYLPAAYSARDLAGKAAAKRALLDSVNLPADAAALGRPLFGLVSRLTDQKGFDLLGTAMEDLLRLDATWILLGSGERRYEEDWVRLAARHPTRISTTIGFDDRLEHLIVAGADLFLMPSNFEPCGLNQMNSQRYGTPPIVHATGGLDDTVRDSSPGRTGFKFAEYTPAALLEAVQRALQLYRRPGQWRKVQAAAMRRDYSWDGSALEYVKVYSAHS